MLKSFIVTLAIGGFAVTGFALNADAQSRPCIKAPKDYTPCPLTHQRPEFVNLRSSR
jgi:hypothetical protein